ncbi:zinc finger protein 518A [Trichomycterus rosablanca]|uniref:zinc finger protein 518A n=1 Tax=Trichomycterus rosablanca TaxID=2290929 RepID=UPI002F352030
MEVQQANPSSHQEDKAVDNINCNWHRRLRLRKSSAASLNVKKKIKGEKKVNTEPSESPSQNEHKVDQVVDSSDCKDSTMFSPNDSLKHFESFHGGKRKPTSFPCDMCSFAASESTTLQEHQITHRLNKLTCESCNDILHTSSKLTKHYNSRHCLDSRHPCKKFKFNTNEPSDCPNYTIPAMENSSNKPVNGHLLADAAETPMKEELLKHMGSLCNRKWGRKNWWKRKEVPPTQPDNDIPDIKFLIPKTEVPWPASGFLPFSAPGLLDENGELLNPVRILEETEQFLERTVNSGKKWPVILKGQPSLSCAETFPSEPHINQRFVQFPTLRSSEKDKLCGLMEKNNISIPPNCTTKVVGFKMVDGKKHLIVKVIPLTKTNNPHDAGKKSLPLTEEDLNDTQLHSYFDRLSNQICNGLSNTCTESSSVNQDCNSTSSSVQPDDQGLGDKHHEDSAEIVSQGKNNNSYCNDDQHACCDNLNAPAQLAISGTKNFNVTNHRHSDAQPTSPGLVSSFNNGNYINEGNADVSREVSPVGEAAILTHYTENRENTKKLMVHQEKAIRHEENHPELSTDLSSTISFNLDSLEEGVTSNPSAVPSDDNKSPHIDTNKSVKGPTILQKSLVHPSKQTLKHISSCPAFPDSGATFERNIDPTPVFFQKSTTDFVCNSLSEDTSLLFQDSGEKYTNSIDPRHSHLPPGLDCTCETVEEPYVALSSEEDSFYNADLYQTLEELPVTTANHLIINSENTFTGNAKKSAKSSRFSSQQLCMYSLKAIPDSSQSNLQPSPLTESPVSRKRQQDPTTQSSQEPVSKSRTQTAPKTKEHELQASVPYWEPALPATERTLRLMPVYSSQPVKIPRLNQPVVVLNHPDADIPEVTNIMRSVHRNKGAVQKVLLSQGTSKALSELNCEPFLNSAAARSFHSRRAWPQGTVKERFILKLKLKRFLGSKFKVAPSGSKMSQSSFRCWFCGRVFRTQEVWIGHGQRHLMEATRDWNKVLNYNIVM